MKTIKLVALLITIALFASSTLAEQTTDPNKPGEYADWAKKFLRQVCSFPEAGGHDDYVDSLSQALRVL
ncbi:MAG: hypothetical protein ACFFCX_18050, partial [Candidatus Sifarchaeia archaeon]